MTGNVSLRKATLKDMDLLIRLRLDYLREDKGDLSENEINAIQKQLQEYFSAHIPDETFIGIIAEADGAPVSTAYLAVSERPANPAFITGRTGVLLNVLTYPAYRRKGIATKVILSLMGEAKRLNVSMIELKATNDGKPLYEKLGFSLSKHTSMSLLLPRQ